MKRREREKEKCARSAPSEMICTLDWPPTEKASDGIDYQSSLAEKRLDSAAEAKKMKRNGFDKVKSSEK